MGRLTAIWTHATTNRPLWLTLSAGLVVLGVLLIADGEIQGWGWTRLIGAGVITVGSILFGVLVGWSDPVRPRITSTLYQLRKLIAVLLAVIMIVPLLVGLIVGVFGTVAGGEAGWTVTLTGLILTLLLLALSAGTAGLALVQALRGLDRSIPEQNGHADGQEPS